MQFTFNRTHLACFVALVTSGFFTQASYSNEYFNPALLEVDNPSMKGADLSSFESGSQAPGKYRVDIIINDQMVDTREVEFKNVKQPDGKEILKPCLSAELLQTYGVKIQLFPEIDSQDECIQLASIPDASSQFIFGSQKLVLSIPQAAMSPEARGYVSPKLWDEGITAGLLNYSLSGDSTRARKKSGSNSNSQYANLRPGLNVGPWRVRNYTTWNRDTNGQDKWETVYTYAQRNIVTLKSQMTLGDSSSPSDVFDSIPFRGGQIASDDDMLPDSLKGYAPVVRGIARTNAQVVIRQNGYVIYQSYVAPGAFEITDMFPTGGSGDLNVTVKEADGSEQNFIVPFASVPVLQREGHLKYSLTAGQYRSYNSSVEKTPLVQGTAIYGLAHGFTLYGGVQQSSKYQSLAMGVGKNLGDIGAISTDVIQAESAPKDGQKSSGQSWRIRYSKNFADTGTNFSIAGYRYSTAGYYGMQEILDSYGDSSALDNRRRNRAELTISQSLGGKLGAITGSAVREDYWNINKSMESFSLGYNNSWNGISYGINYTYSKNSDANGTSGGKIYDKDQMIALNISIPLDRFLSNTWANYSLNNSKQGNTTHTMGISGTSLEGNALSWNVQQGYGTDNAGYTGNANADYRGTYGEVTGGYSYDTDTQRTNFGLSGGILAHSEGITLSQPLGETIALVNAPGANGVSVMNQTGVKTDFRGYTVVSNLSAYRKNDIALDTATLPDDVELELTAKTVMPTRGAVVRAVYKANVGSRILMTLTLNNGHPVPFGAMATISGAENTQGFIVGEAGQVYLSGLNETGILSIQWGESADEKCHADFNVNKNVRLTDSQIYLINSICKPV
ncbi:fimbria/pilus outer membrane usher protein [Rahnella selenatireducens]|uniref:fimbria/pilus outer membrane usher protein n=1 Tax=Rahnella selenatireducens TaxID=3389797 RepID=UPI003967E166